MIVLVYLLFVSIDTIDVNLFCGLHNTREIREVLANFFRDLMKDKLAAEILPTMMTSTRSNSSK